MSSKLKVAGWVALGAVAGALATMQLQANARSRMPFSHQKLSASSAMSGQGRHTEICTGKKRCETR